MIFLSTMISTIDNVTLIGTAHVSSKSAELVKYTITQINPDVIAIELDKERLQSLLEKHNVAPHSSNSSSNSKHQSKHSFIDRNLIKKIGLFGFMFLKIAGFLQQKIGKTLQIEPGIDMLAGVLCAKENNTPICLADRPILQTISKFKSIPFLKKVSMIKRMIFIDMSFDERKELAKKLQKGDLDSHTINTVIEKIKNEIPEFYDILIHQRNVYMANEIVKLRKKGANKIVLVIGAGHLVGIEEILKEELKKLPKDKDVLENKTEFSFKVE